MVFSSLIFCTIFLPLCLLVYYGAPRIIGGGQERKIILSNYILLCFSLIFYAFGGIKYLLLIIAVIYINWSVGFLVTKGRHGKVARRVGLIAAILFDMGLLFFFKYYNPQEIVLPVGISFFTFQALSYVIDVYNDTVEVQENPFYFALYISCFPQLVAGPIVHYKDIAGQLTDRVVGSYEFQEGIKRFCFGLGKKVLIANTLAVVVDQIWSGDISKLDSTVAWLGAICYSFQIYFDFSGYSDMAIGLGKMFGFDFKENFNHPYRAESVRDFWRRWHISLSSWFRDYVYIPLGGSRCCMARICLNIFVVFLLTGIWHGANITFLVWGVVYGVLLIFERLFLGKILEKNPIKFLNRMLIFIVVTILWVVFRAPSVADAGIFISRMFVGGFKPINLVNHLSGLSVIAFICACLFGGFVQAHMSVKAVKGNAFVCLGLLLLSLLFLVNGTYNPFIYYQF
ncbi:MBOAT family O-acyltransferase [Pseudobutyrivibrio xylanivorans]|uniref:Alginate O-acetyltransferase complex protein AlgI n=1 Tax=Pseudobutyrivibrio xylanivorans DSM 14809 TaxID=1123012 RepID=A0A1M6L4P6_PSEXY|nr:MBOAT family O-acyltransferase [Pseudobutyrivibrio xylanivorans]SHJ66172.1 alginate O-acetyltransferase complex protein AlgI [Pseudobutyrivibrio xylanivorans DSM 14809]